jgi:DNA-binding NtrC family response regulator
VLARLIHALGARLNQPFFKVNCGAMSQLSRGLFGWELFGSATGRASTPGQPSDRGLLREAGSGTVLLDEITALPDQSQVLLEQVVRTRRFVAFGGQAEQELACRVLATTCRNAEAAVLGKELREDLFKAVSAATLHVPALRERREDILPLADAFLQRFAAQAQRVVKGFTPAAAATLERFDWPGNVRQLENLIESVVLTTDSDLVDVEHLPFGIRAEVARKTMAGH